MRVERIQKVLAARGLGSRREIEEWIRRGEVKVNGRVATLGDGYTPGDRIDVRGRTIHDTGLRHRWIAYHKPEGEVCTRKDEQGRPTIYARLPKVRGGRWVSVGRLDLNTSGLLLLTTDGELAHGLMHPSSGIERTYAVRVLGTMPDDALERLMQGVELEDGPARALSAVEAGGQGANRWIHVTVAEGRNRLVRRLFMALGATVSRLIRVRYGAVELGNGLRSGAHRELEPDEVRWLYAAAGLRCPLDVPHDDAPRKARFRDPSRGTKADPSGQRAGLVRVAKAGRGGRDASASKRRARAGDVSGGERNEAAARATFDRAQRRPDRVGHASSREAARAASRRPHDQKGKGARADEQDTAEGGAPRPAGGVPAGGPLRVRVIRRGASTASSPAAAAAPSPR